MGFQLPTNSNYRIYHNTARLPASQELGTKEFQNGFLPPGQRGAEWQPGRRISLRLRDKLWDRLEIEEDEEPFWYLLNCVAGLELDLLRQCRKVCEGMPDAIKFVVPTETKTRSHGANRMVTEEKVKYQGYVFAKLRLSPDVYEAVQR